MDSNVRELPRTNPEDAAHAALGALCAGSHVWLEWDLASGRIEWLGLPGDRFLGHAPGGLHHIDLLAGLLHSDDQLAWQMLVDQADLDPPRARAVECRWRSADGGWRWLEVRGQPRLANSGAAPKYRFTAILQDITARKRQEAQLALSALLLESVSDATLVTNAAGRIQWANGAAANLFDLPLAALTGRSLADFSADDRERQLELQQEQRDGIARSGQWRGSCLTQTASGAGVPTEASITRVQGDDGELWLHTRRDLRERLELKRDAQRASRREQQRLGEQLQESLGQDLTAAALLLRGLVRDLPPAVLPQISDIDTLLSRAIRECRDMAQAMPAFTLQQHGLSVALRSLAREAAAQGLRARVEVATDADQVSADVATAVYRLSADVLQEVSRHATGPWAQGRRIEIRVTRERGQLRAVISDELPRLAPQPVPDAASYGIDVLGGRIDALRMARGGRQLIVQIPLGTLAAHSQVVTGHRSLGQ